MLANPNKLLQMADRNLGPNKRDVSGKNRKDYKTPTRKVIKRKV